MSPEEARAREEAVQDALHAASVALPVLATMCKCAGLSLGHAKAVEMQVWIDDAIAAFKDLSDES